jgi:hypothetical protein
MEFDITLRQLLMQYDLPQKVRTLGKGAYMCDVHLFRAASRSRGQVMVTKGFFSRKEEESLSEGEVL